MIKSKYFHALGHRYYRVNDWLLDYTALNNEQKIRHLCVFIKTHFTQVISTVREKRIEEKAAHRNTWINFTSITKFICLGTLAIGICSNFSCTFLKVWISKEDYDTTTKQSVLIFLLVHRHLLISHNSIHWMWFKVIALQLYQTIGIHDHHTQISKDIHSFHDRYIINSCWLQRQTVSLLMDNKTLRIWKKFNWKPEQSVIQIKCQIFWLRLFLTGYIITYINSFLVTIHVVQVSPCWS